MNLVVSTVLIMALSISVVSLVLSYGLPLIDEQKTNLEFQHGKNIINSIAIDISDLLGRPVGSSFQKEIEFSNGKLEFLNHTIKFSLGQKTYNRTFPKTRFSNLTLLVGRNNLTFIKIFKDFVEIKSNIS